MHINHIYTAIYALKEDIDSLYEYMRVLSTQQLNPLIMPPDILREVLNQVREGIRSDARLTLSENPLENIWTYYNIIKVTPIVLDDFLMVILTVPLIDSSLNVNLYCIHNLPMLHPTLEIQVEYELEGMYFATHMHGMYATIPKATDIKLCMMTQGHLCMFDEPLYPVDKLNWCIYALFTNNLDKMKKNYRVRTSVQNTNMAYSPDGYLWAISSLVTEKLQIRCMQQTSVVTIHPPLQIIDIGNGCEAFSLTIYIPTKSELTAMMQSLTRSQFFLKYNFKYINMSTFIVFQNLTVAELTLDEKAQLKSKVKLLEPMNMDLLNQKLQLINDDYPLSLPPWAILSFQLVSGGFILTEISMMTWLCIKHRKSIPMLLKFGFSLAHKIHQNPSIIEHLIQQADHFLHRTPPLNPPPRPKLKPPCETPVPAVSASVHQTSTDDTLPLPALPGATTMLSHCKTLDFITEAAQELYARGQLRVKPYAKYLKKECRGPAHKSSDDAV